MKNSVLKVIVAIVIVTCSYHEAKSQVSILGNNSLNMTDFSGWDNTVTFPFNVRHDGFQPIVFSTNTFERMRITEYGNVSIGGVDPVSPKLHVALNNMNASFGTGPFRSYTIYGRNFVSNLSNENIAVFGAAQGFNEDEGDDNVGGFFEAQNAWRNIAVDGFVGNGGGNNTVGDIGWCIRAEARDHTLSNVGIVARATYGAGSTTATELVGLSAGIDGALGNPNEWAGAFQGDVQVWGDVYADNYFSPSDEQFKTNIEPLENALTVINSITPKKYEFINEQFTHLNFPEGEQFGVIAQDLLEVVPELVEESRMLTKYDSLGNVIADPIEFLAVNYDGLIPILIAGMKEQQSIIEAQNDALADVMDQLNALQDQVNGCCGGDAAPKNFGGEGNEEQLQSPSKSGNVLEQNNPNPFRNQTTINYALNEGGKVLLNVYDKSGKVVTTLAQGEQQSGTYRYEWDASGLPAGLYHYALYVDGELLIKKAIKLAD